MSEASDPGTPLLKDETPTTAKSTWRLYWELCRMNQFPTGTISLFWPCVWAYLLASRNDPPESYMLLQCLALIFVTTTLIHCAACVHNDICDRELDRQVERCKGRPIASGAVSVPKAVVFLISFVVPSVYMLTLVNRTATVCGLIGIFPLHGVYPLMKRWTNWPQAYLGLAMSWGYPTTWLMVAPQELWSPLICIPLFGMVCWIILADTMYACQDREDDIKAGVKSTAVIFGSYIRPILSIFATIFVVTLAYTGIATNMPPPYFVIGVAGCAFHMLWQMVTLNPDDHANCLAKFLSNRDLGYIITAGVITGVYFPGLLTF